MGVEYEFPLISVVIPTYNRPEQLKHCLQSLTEQNYKGMWEVIVVDDGGNFDLEAVTNLFEKQLKLSLIVQKNRGPATARNNGVRHAQGDYIAFLDDDCEPRKDWLAQISKCAQQDTMIGGLTINKLTDNSYSETSQLIVSFLYEYFQNTPWFFFTSNNFLVSRRNFLQIGGFDESFSTSAGEDREFCMRWLANGFSMTYESTAKIDHAHDLSFSSFWRQHFKYGKASLLFQQKMKELGVKPLPFRLSFYFLLIAYPFRDEKYNLKIKFSLFILTFISQLATTFGFLSSIKSKTHR